MTTLFRNEDDTLESTNEDDRLYVRRGNERGFSEDEIVEINRMRFHHMKYGEHICTEDALEFARAILSRFGK